VSVAGLGVVVLTYGTAGTHRELLQTLLAQGVPATAIVVVHNPSRPGEPGPELPPGCELVRCERNGGYSGGMNRGLERWAERPDRPQLLLLASHDARLRPGALDALLAAAERAPGYGVLAPALLLAGSEEPFSFGGDSDGRGVTTHRKRPPTRVEAGISRCDWVDGGTMLVRAEAVARVGEFDERFWSYCEESELCLRLRRAGFGVGVVPAAVADQDPGGSKRLGAWAYLLTRNSTEYARRAAGPRAAAWAIARQLRFVALNLARIPVRLLRPRPGGIREPWLLAVGTAWGTVDFLRRRWGPPPRRLPGTGDVANV
jgi:N-acetylglucosaminyl-diphospho-decaprenol L-rhamnosyltransferase